jgi:Ca-activated chloride channel family protein
VTFARPELLVLAPLASLLFALALGMRFRRLRRLGEAYREPAFARLLPVGVGRLPTARLACLLLAGAAIGLAAAGPAWSVPVDEAPLPPLDVSVAVDLSLSMTATDAAPTRIARAREVIELLSQELPSVRFSLVMFAGFPHMVLPPTDDPTLLAYFAQSLGVELVGRNDRGDAIGDALYWAGEALDERPSDEARRLVLLFSDGGDEAPGPTLEAATWLDSTRVEVWVAALGSSSGSAIFAEGTPVLDRAGAPVVARLNEDLLRDAAEAGGGRYFNVSDEAGLAALLDALREASGDRDDPPPPPVDAAFLLVLLAIPLLLWEGAADAGRDFGRARSPEVPS